MTEPRTTLADFLKGFLVVMAAFGGKFLRGLPPA
jgi:hypothetical protein